MCGRFQFTLILFLGVAPVHAQAPGRPVEGGKTSPDGKVEIQCDLPESQKKRNIGSPPPQFPGDRRSLGCCVFRSIDYAAHWQHITALYDFPEWMVKSGIEGGGYPQKVDQLLPRLAKERGADVKYGQHTGGDEAVLQAILDSGRGACITYNGFDPHYSGSIAHMVWLCHFDRKTGWACISDNNAPKDNQFVWMSCDELLKRWRGNQGGWAVFLLASPPPPPPLNWTIGGKK